MNRLVLALAAAAGSASAQTPSLVYSMVAEPAWVEVGQTATISVYCAFTPGIAGAVTTPAGPGTVLGLASGGFRLMANAALWTLGAPPSGSLIAPYNAPGTSQGMVAGANVFGVVWGNGAPPPLGQVSTLNPTPIWRGTFTKVTPQAIINLVPEGGHLIWASVGGQAIGTSGAATAGPGIVMLNVPSASPIAVLAGAIGVGNVRRRRRPASPTRRAQDAAHHHHPLAYSSARTKTR